MARLGLILSGVACIASLAAVSTLVMAQPTNDPVGDILRKTEPPKAEEPKVPAVKPPAATNAPAATNTPVVVPRPAPPVAQSAEPKAPPDRRPRFPVAILQALDKVTAQSIRFEAPVNQPIRFHNLVITVRSCETTTADEPADDAIAFVEIEAQNPSASRALPATRQVFKGWMFADSPSINPLQHPVYDAWLIACKA